MLSLGIGYPNPELVSLRRSVTDTGTNISNVNGGPLFHAKYELFLARHVGLALTANYGKISYVGTYSATAGSPQQKSEVAWSTLAYCFRLNCHILYRKPLDVYFGAAFGFRSDRFDFLQASPKLVIRGTSGSLELSAGARYFYKGIIGLYLEAGLGRACPVQTGLVLNLHKPSA